ncbi:50S ribosomal protein L7/L12 [Candidatus Dependentiae bacterium]|nr:50S ribosomal protein L7/L12 [Candidatus Dependentiae bacterium]
MSKNFDQIIGAIENMNVLELAELVKALETKFGVSAATMAAPVAAADGESTAAAAVEKTEFKVVLKDMGPDKIKTIQALRKVVTLGLAEAKKMVESAPIAIADAASKEDAQKMKETLEAVGAKVELA